METLYKLTDASARTKNDYTWGEGVTLHADPDLPAELCSAGVIHAYRSPLVALFLNPIHANIVEPVLWEAQGEVCVDDGTKVGCRALTTVRRLEYTAPTTTQRVAFGVLASLEACKEPKYKAWADGWLHGYDRSEAAARAATWAAEAAARAAARAATRAATREAAEWAARAAAKWAAAEAARAAARAAEQRIDLHALAVRAMEVK